jgi:hypothetical protein
MNAGLRYERGPSIFRWIGVRTFSAILRCGLSSTIAAHRHFLCH